MAMFYDWAKERGTVDRWTIDPNPVDFSVQVHVQDETLDLKVELAMDVLEGEIDTYLFEIDVKRYYRATGKCLKRRVWQDG